MEKAEIRARSLEAYAKAEEKDKVVANDIAQNLIAMGKACDRSVVFRYGHAPVLEELDEICRKEEVIQETLARIPESKRELVLGAVYEIQEVAEEKISDEWDAHRDRVNVIMGGKTKETLIKAIKIQKSRAEYLAAVEGAVETRKACDVIESVDMTIRKERAANIRG